MLYVPYCIQQYYIYVQVGVYMGRWEDGFPFGTVVEKAGRVFLVLDSRGTKSGSRGF